MKTEFWFGIIDYYREVGKYKEYQKSMMKYMCDVEQTERLLEYSFRQCKKSDIDFIYTLKEQCFKWYVEKIYGWNKDIQIEYTRKEMAERLEDMNIIQNDGKDIGVFTFFYDKKRRCVYRNVCDTA